MNYMKSTKNVLAQGNKILNLTLNVQIQNHAVEGSSKKNEI